MGHGAASGQSACVATLRVARNAYLNHQSPARRPVRQSSPCACARARASAPRSAPCCDPARRPPPLPLTAATQMRCAATGAAWRCCHCQLWGSALQKPSAVGEQPDMRPRTGWTGYGGGEDTSEHARASAALAGRRTRASGAWRQSPRRHASAGGRGGGAGRPRPQAARAGARPRQASGGAGPEWGKVGGCGSGVPA
jgi:hypothetical protein